MLNVEDYNYKLPEDYIAKYPPEQRGDTNLLVYFTQSNEIEITKYKELYKYLPPKTLVVRNRTKVFNARLYVQANPDIGKKIELFLLSIKAHDLESYLEKQIQGDKITVPVLIRLPFKKLKRIKNFYLDNWVISVEFNESQHEYRATFTNKKVNNLKKAFIQLINTAGHVPIPPYFKREDTEVDKKRYQTVFAKESGSVAAPTASLNFTQTLEQKLTSAGVSFADVILHVGLGTFSPVREFNITSKKLHTEYIYIDSTNISKIMQAYRNTSPILAIGTTTVRTLESLNKVMNLDSMDIKFKEIDFVTDLFIYPPFAFKFVDMLLTNFHLPKSSLLMLVDAFLRYKQAKKNWRDLYEVAIKQNFKFFSYGDSMLIL